MYFRSWIGLLFLFFSVFFTVDLTYAGGPAGRLLCFGGPQHGDLCFGSNSCPGGQCIGGTFCKGGPDTGNLCLEDTDCTAGKCVNIGRVGFFLPRVCQDGPNKGDECRVDDDCGGGACVLHLVPPGSIKAILTIIVDDDQSGVPASGILPAPCPGLSTERGATFLLEVTKNGQQHFLSESFRCLVGGLGDTGFGFMTSETGLNNAIRNASLLNHLLFRGTTSADMSKALRDLFNSSGQPIIVATPKAISAVKRTIKVGSGRTRNGLASVVRLEVSIGFTPAE